MNSYRYITQFADMQLASLYSELVHFAPSLPQAIKEGRAYVRELNRSLGYRPGIKRYYYVHTYRAR